MHFAHLQQRELLRLLRGVVAGHPVHLELCHPQQEVVRVHRRLPVLPVQVQALDLLTLEVKVDLEKKGKTTSVGS